MVLIQLSFTITFSSLFLKTYRISKIFNTKLQKIDLSDFKLFIVICIIILFECIFLIIIFFIGKLDRNYEKGITIIDNNNILILYTYLWGKCIPSKSLFNYLIICLIFIKFICFSYGIHLVLSIVKIKRRKYNEAFEIMIACIIVVMLLFIIFSLQITLPINNQFYCNLRFIGIILPIFFAIILSNTSLFFGRIYAIFNKKESDYKSNDAIFIQNYKNELRKAYDNELKSIKKDIEYEINDNELDRVIMETNKLLTPKNTINESGINIQEPVTPVASINTTGCNTLDFIDKNSILPKA